jgi:hypothetical protein
MKCLIESLHGLAYLWGLVTDTAVGLKEKLDKYHSQRRKMHSDNAIKSGVNFSGSGRNYVAAITAAIFVLSLTSGCGSAQVNTPGEVQANTQLAISPNGNRLLISWNDSSGKLHARLAELNGTVVASERDISLPEDTLTTSFGNSNDYVLLTTWNKKNSSLIKINLGKDDPEIIYKSDFLMRFPLEAFRYTQVAPVLS